VIVVTSLLLELAMRLKSRALAAVFQSGAALNVMSNHYRFKENGAFVGRDALRRKLQVEVVPVPA